MTSLVVVVGKFIWSKMDNRNENMEKSDVVGVDNLAFELSPEDPESDIQFQDLPKPEENRIETFLNKFENVLSCQEGIQQHCGQTQ